MRRTQQWGLLLVLLLASSHTNEAITVSQTLSHAHATYIVHDFMDTLAGGAGKGAVGVDVLSQLTKSPTMRSLFEVASASNTAQSILAAVAAHPKASQKLLESSLGAKAVAVVQQADKSSGRAFDNSPIPSADGWLRSPLDMANANTDWEHVATEMGIGQILLAEPNATTGAISFLETATEKFDVHTVIKLVDTLNYAWFAVFALAFISCVVSSVGYLVTMGKVKLKGVGLSAMVACLVLLVAVCVFCSEFIGIGIMGKHIAASMVNTLGVITDVAAVDKAIADVKGDLKFLPNANLQKQRAHKLESTTTTLVGTSVQGVAYSHLHKARLNICNFAWDTENDEYIGEHMIRHLTMNYVGDNVVVRYKNDGPLDTWSPISLFNSERKWWQKKIPNPQYCCYKNCGSNGPYYWKDCPSRWLALEGRDDPCSCLEAMQQMGFEFETDQMVDCVLHSRDRVVAKAEELYNKYKEQLEGAADKLKDYSETAAASCTKAYNSGTLSNTGGGAISEQLYSNGGFLDSAADKLSSDVFTDFGSTTSGAVSVAWEVHNCASNMYTVDFRYVADAQVTVELFVDDISQGSKTITATATTTPMRNNFVFKGFALSEGVHKLRIVKTESQAVAGPKIHRMNLCLEQDSTTEGCVLEKLHNKLYCYEERGSSKMPSQLQGSGLRGSDNESFASLDTAKDVCSSRADCQGVQQEAGSSGMVYQLRYGAVTTSTDASAVAFVRNYC